MGDDTPQYKWAPLLATDAIILATLAFFTLLTLVFCRRIDAWGVLVLKNLAVGVAYLTFQQFAARTPS